jgi:tripartite-type tricarboxylate transporter receptor subunit TctC
VPTVAEQGFAGFEMTQWYGLLAPASLAQEHADKLALAAARSVKEPAALKLLESDAALAVGSTAAEFARFIQAEQQRWKPVIARAKIKPD